MILSFSSTTDLQPDQAEAEDTEEELVDGIEDCCSPEENEEEEGKKTFHPQWGFGHILQEGN
jgi:hypothetical protein